MAFDSELEAFNNFAQVMPENTALLVDTYNTLQGVQHAIDIGQQLRQQGHDLLAIRLDSGDVATLSRKARHMLDQAGFTATQIIASGDLDEYQITTLKTQHAAVDVWGVGTRLVTAYDQPAFDMVYKLVAIKNAHQQWDYKIKISDTPDKTTLPGLQQVRRYYKGQRLIGDVIYEIIHGVGANPFTATADCFKDLLAPIFKHGQLVYDPPSTQQIRHYCMQQQQDFLTSHVKKYPVQIDPSLAELTQDCYMAIMLRNAIEG